MKNLRKFVLSVISVMALASCVNDNLSEPWESDVNKVLASVADQAKAVESSIEVVEALQDAVKAEGVEIAGAAELLGQHVDALSAGMSLSEGSLATLELQKQLASILGAAQAELYFADALDQNIQKSFALVEKSVNIWLGEILVANYPAAFAEARVGAIAAEFEKRLADQELTVEALKSDIEAGLRKDENPAEITGLSVSVAKASQEVETLAGEMVLLAAEVEEEYKAALKTLTSDPASFDGESLSELNSKVATKAEASDRSITDLAADVKECQETLANLQQRLEVLEGNVSELLGMIQSVTFVSDYPDDRAVAYYRMSSELNVERAAEGKMDRVPENTFDLNFLIRPAAVADALDQMWNSGQKDVLSIIGYYAHQIQQASADYKFINFEVSKVVSSRGKGLLTVTVDNAFSDEFYFKEVGAKLALSVESGQNNCTSKFVEIAPMDITGKVYAESLTLTPTSLSIQNGDTYQLEAVVYPANVTDKGCTWNDYDSEYVSVDANGNLTATAVGKSQVIVYANATDEFGRQLSATCNVTVTPAIRIVGPQSVEIGKSAVMEIESPNYINPTDVTWELEWAGNSAYLALTDNKDATCTIEGVAKNFGRPAGASAGASSEYLPINVKCTIGGNAEPIVLMHSVCVVEVQPRVIVIDGLANDQNKMTVKKGSTYQFNSSIEPAGVKMDLFGIIYQSGSSHVATIDFRSGLLTTVGYGTANISVEVNDKTSESYFYPKRELFQKFERVVAVTVEPYWVVGLSLPRIEEPLAPESTGTFTPIFTSDVEGEQPSVQSLIWESSNEDVIEVDPETGAYKAKGVGTATITATTTGEWSTKGDPISATCDITVELLENLPTIGDYYYLDGTWSSTYIAGNNPIGVVFAIIDATRTDSKLDAKMDKTTALVVGLNQYNSTFGAFSTGYSSTGKWFVENGYDNANIAATNGYSNSIGLSDYRDVKQSGASGVEDVAFNLTNFPSGTSGWYIPSYQEMKLLYGQKSVINNSLKTRGTEISDDDYWISSLQWTTDGFYDVMSLYPFSMSSGDWGASKDKSTSLPVRVVLAF